MKKELLIMLEKEIADNSTLPLCASANLVFGEGNVDAQVMFIGEAPGEQEDRDRRPFVGRAGQLLRKMIREIGWSEEGVYITNIVKRRPPANRDPLPEEIVAYRPYLTKQISIINPEMIVPLGRFSMNYFLPDAKISRDQGKLFVAQHRVVVPIFHPAAALRSLQMMEAFQQAFRKLPELLRESRSTPRDIFFGDEEEGKEATSLTHETPPEISEENKEVTNESQRIQDSLFS